MSKRVNIETASTEDKVWAERLQKLTGQLRDHFRREADAERDLQLDYYDVIEYVVFGHLGLEITDAPSVVPILPRSEIEFTAMTDPRLNLHLESYGGLYETRRQLGRIARYIDARGLHHEYPIIAATTYPKLARVVRTIMPEMVPAPATYFADNKIKRSIDDARVIFDRKNNFVHEITLPESLVATTEEFTKRWIDQG